MTVQFWPEVAGAYHASTGLHLQEQDAATFLNVSYAYFVAHPNEFRHDVRDNFEEYLTGISEVTGSKAQDDRPLVEQAAGMMDQLLELESVLGSGTFAGATSAAPKDPPPDLPPKAPTTPAYPTVEID